MKIFKLSHSQLLALLPESSFSAETSNIDTAVATACDAMQQQGGCSSVSFHEALQRALPVLPGTSGFVVIQNIRRWALELLQDEEASGGETVCSEPIPYPELPDDDERVRVETRMLTARQARGILANAFFRNIHDPMEKEKDYWNTGGLDWHRLFDLRCSCAIERLKCHLLYFEAMLNSDKEDLDRGIVFERIRYKPIDFLCDSRPDMKKESTSYVGKRVVLHSQPMESAKRNCSAFVNFANPNYGYGRFIASATQEEILESCCPEITIGLLWIGKLHDDEVVNVRNVRRFATYSGYLDTFQCQGPWKDSPVIQDILTMDACFRSHFTNQNINRDINKAHAAFLVHRQLNNNANGSDNKFVVSTGKWGCGAFRGLASHKFAQQLLAAHEAGVELEFSVFGDPESCDVLLQAFQTRKPSCKQVGMALKACQRRESFVQDFVACLQGQTIV